MAAPHQEYNAHQRDDFTHPRCHRVECARDQTVLSTEVQASGAGHVVVGAVWLCGSVLACLLPGDRGERGESE